MNDFFVDGGPASPLLSLHHLTTLDATPGRLVELASRAGCAGVCLFTHVPDAGRGRFPLVTRAEAAALRALLDDSGVVVANAEIFPLDGRGIDAMEPGLATAAALGATRVTVHIHDAGRAQAIDRLGAFAETAAAFGISPGLEFNAFSAVTTIADAVAIVRAVGAGRARLVIDSLHLFRGGGTIGEAAAAADLVDYAQLSDGPPTIPPEGRWREAVSDRLRPGEGAFPLVDLMSRLRRGTVVSVEVPCTSAARAGVPDTARVDAAVAAARRVTVAAW